MQCDHRRSRNYTGADSGASRTAEPGGRIGSYTSVSINIVDIGLQIACSSYGGNRKRPGPMDLLLSRAFSDRASDFPQRTRKVQSHSPSLRCRIQPSTMPLAPFAAQSCGCDTASDILNMYASLEEHCSHRQGHEHYVHGDV